MTMIDDPIGATPKQLSDELIFLIASASTDDQRKYATDLFRHFARQVAVDAYRRGQQSVAVPELSAPPTPGDAEAPAIQPSDGQLSGDGFSDAALADGQPSGDQPPNLIPQVRWQD